MTTPTETTAKATEGPNFWETARARVGRRRGEKFLESILSGDKKGIDRIWADHLRNGPKRNYGAIEKAFNETVGDVLARDYAGMFDEMNMGNTLYFMETRLQGLKSDKLPQGVRKVIGRTLGRLYQS